MRQFLLFAGDHYYPSGGYNDFKESFDSIVEAEVAGAKYDWCHVVDAFTHEIVCERWR
jgi:hypothetical protein